MTPSYPTASLTRSQGMVFHRFSGDPVTRSKRTHPWMSGVTMLVRWLCSSPASERHVKWVCLPSFFPGLRKCTPRQKKKRVREPTGCAISKATQEGLSRGSCCHWIRQGMHPNSLEKVRVREGAVGPSFSQRATSRVPGYGGEDLQNVKKAKTKASDQSRGESPKGQPPDHQARRRSRKETLSQVAQNERERVIGQHEEKTQWMTTARKVQQRKPAPPMRKNRPE